MKGIYSFLLFIIIHLTALSQNESQFHGQLLSQDSSSIYGVNIINLTHSYGTVSKDDGTFTLPVFIGDTIEFSAIQYKNVQLYITQSLLNRGNWNQIMVFDSIVLNDIVLTDRFSMIDTTHQSYGEIEMGLPFNTTPIVRPYQERRLDYLKGGIIGSIVNQLNGKTKKMERYIALKKENEIIDEVRNVFDNALYANLGIPENEIYLFIEIYFKEARAKGLLKEGNHYELIAFFREKAMIFVASRQLLADSIQN